MTKTKTAPPEQLFSEPEVEYRRRALRWLLNSHKYLTIENVVRYYTDEIEPVSNRTMSRALADLKERGWAEPRTSPDDKRVTHWYGK